MAQKNTKRSVAMLALLRGVNVGGKNLVPMKDLAELFADAGCTAVRTYIQSGNVVFRADSHVAESLSTVVTKAIAERFGHRVPVVLFALPELQETIRENPFLENGVDEASLHVYFLAHTPSAEAVAALDPQRSPPDAFAVKNRAVYLHLPSGMAKTKLTNLYFDKKLSTVATARNWRTTLKLLELMQGH